MDLITEKTQLGENKVRLVTTLPTADDCNRRIQAYFTGLKKGFTAFAEKRLLPRVESGDTAGAVLNCVITHENADCLSCYTDVAVTAGGVSRYSRISGTWDKRSGTVLSFAQLFDCRKKVLASLLADAAGEKMQRASRTLYSDYRERARKRLNTEHFYISPNGVVFYYLGGDISDYPRPFAVPLGRESVLRYIKKEKPLLLWGG